MNENQMRRKSQDRAASLRDFRYDFGNADLSPMEIEANRVNAATREEDKDIGPSGQIPNEVWR